MRIYFLLILSFCFGLYLWIGKKAADKIKTDKDYFLMGRSLTFFPLMMTLFATMLGGGVLVGAAQTAYSSGWAVLIYPVGTLVGFVILGLGFGSRLRKLNINTVAEIFEVMYNSSALRIVASIISTVSLYTILIGQGVAIKSFFLSMGLGSNWFFYAFWAAFVAYTVMGGFKAVVDTDVLQASFILIGSLIAFCSLDFSLIKTSIISSPSAAAADIPWSAWFLMPLCFTLIGQDMGQRCFAVKTTKSIAPASLFAGGLLVLTSGVAIIIGLMVANVGLSVPQGSSILIAGVMKFTPPVIGLIFSTVIIMAITSTADSLLCCISSNICYDFDFMRGLPMKKQLFISRAITFVLGVSALVFTMLCTDVIKILVFAYELSISVLFISIFMGVVFQNTSKKAAWISVLSGAFGFFLFRILNISDYREVSTLIMSLIGYVSGMLLEKRKSIISYRGW